MEVTVTIDEKIQNFKCYQAGIEEAFFDYRSDCSCEDEDLEKRSYEKGYAVGLQLIKVIEDQSKKQKRM